MPVVKLTVTNKIFSKLCSPTGGQGAAKKRPDRNPASCKIQYPMKNRDKDAD
jgi:hypothetical protein